MFLKHVDTASHCRTENVFILISLRLCLHKIVF